MLCKGISPEFDGCLSLFCMQADAAKLSPEQARIYFHNGSSMGVAHWVHRGVQYCTLAWALSKAQKGFPSHRLSQLRLSMDGQGNPQLVLAT